MKRLGILLLFLSLSVSSSHAVSYSSNATGVILDVTCGHYSQGTQYEIIRCWSEGIQVPTTAGFSIQSIHSASVFLQIKSEYASTGAFHSEILRELDSGMLLPGAYHNLGSLTYSFAVQKKNIDFNKTNEVFIWNELLQFVNSPVSTSGTLKRTTKVLVKFLATF